jgi:hypothetical protein
MSCVRVFFLLTAVAIAGCDSPAPTGQAQADAATASACRQRADEVFDRQNRGQIFSPQSQVNTPFSANYAPNDGSQGLSQLFAHNRMIDDCVRNTGTETSRTGTAPGAGPDTSQPTAKP